VSYQDQAGVRRRVWAAVPFKGPTGSKRRLSGLLDERERARLSLAMLDDVLETLLAMSSIERVLLLRPAGAQHVPSQSSRLTIVRESAGGDGQGAGDNLNGAIRQAQRLARTEGADSLLIVPADLPMVDADDLMALLQAARSAPVVIAPDRRSGGTNALLLSPPDALGPSFGEASFERHRRLAGAAGLSQVVVDRAGLSLDLDTPADVAVLLTDDGRPGRTARFLRDLKVQSRLDDLTLAQARNTTI
jgi:2-phospho-L-lactate guanylyltransferase